MNTDRVSGIGHQLKGGAKDVLGGITGDVAMQAEGKAEKAAGKVQNAIGGARDAVGQDTADSAWHRH